MKYNLLFGTLLVIALLVTACGAPATGLPTETGPLATSIVGTADSALATASPAVGEALETASPAVGEALQTASPAVGEALQTASPAVGTLVSPEAVNTTAAGTASTLGIPVTGSVTIEEEVTETHGTILVDSENRWLYLYTNDTQNGDSSACTDEECMAEWAPVTTVGNPVAGTGVQDALLGTITRDDGTVQVTYNGWPLYYYTGGGLSDSDQNGDEGTWFLVTTDGNAVPG